MHFDPEDIPMLVPDRGTGYMRSIKAGDSGMEIGITYCSGPMDTTDFYKGLPNDACPCDHFGYVLEGSMRARYVDGTEELIQKGEIYYIPKGHWLIYPEPCRHLEINPTKELRELMDHFDKGLSAAAEEGTILDHAPKD
jgi:hypothetical protein